MRRDQQRTASWAGRGRHRASPVLAVSFVTTEHFALQSARAATIAESTGRATMFLASISGGLIALGLVATASHLGTAFYAFGLVILPTLAFVGLVTFERALQTTMDDHLMARRIALLRGYYLDNAPELTRYLLSSTTPTWGPASYPWAPGQPQPILSDGRRHGRRHHRRPRGLRRESDRHPRLRPLSRRRTPLRKFDPTAALGVLMRFAYSALTQIRTPSSTAATTPTNWRPSYPHPPKLTACRSSERTGNRYSRLRREIELILVRCAWTVPGRGGVDRCRHQMCS